MTIEDFNKISKRPDDLTWNWERLCLSKTKLKDEKVWVHKQVGDRVWGGGRIVEFSFNQNQRQSSFHLVPVTKVNQKNFTVGKYFVIPGQKFLLPWLYIKQNQFLQQVSLILTEREMERERERKKKWNQNNNKSKSKARITTRTGEIPLLIPNLSGCCHFFFSVRVCTCIHGYLRIFSRVVELRMSCREEAKKQINITNDSCSCRCNDSVPKSKDEWPNTRLKLLIFYTKKIASLKRSEALKEKLFEEIA